MAAARTVARREQPEITMSPRMHGYRGRFQFRSRALRKEVLPPFERPRQPVAIGLMMLYAAVGVFGIGTLVKLAIWVMS